MDGIKWTKRVANDEATDPPIETTLLLWVSDYELYPTPAVLAEVDWRDVCDLEQILFWAVINSPHDSGTGDE